MPRAVQKIHVVRALILLVESQQAALERIPVSKERRKLVRLELKHSGQHVCLETDDLRPVTTLAGV